jgi:hypothetical protein
MPPRTNDAPRFRRTEVLYARIDEEVMDLIRQLAETNQRSITAVANIVLRKGLSMETQPLFIWTTEEEETT